MVLCFSARDVRCAFNPLVKLLRHSRLSSWFSCTKNMPHYIHLTLEVTYNGQWIAALFYDQQEVTFIDMKCFSFTFCTFLVLKLCPVQALHLRVSLSNWKQSNGKPKMVFILSNLAYFTLVYTTQVSNTFRAHWLASSEVISQVLFTSEQPKKNKMAFVAIFSQIKLFFVPLVIHLV